MCNHDHFEERTEVIQDLKFSWHRDFTVSSREFKDGFEIAQLDFGDGICVRLKVEKLTNLEYRFFASLFVVWSTVLPEKLRQTFHRFAWSNRVLSQFNWLIWLLSPEIHFTNSENTVGVILTYSFLERRKTRVWMAPYENSVYVHRLNSSSSWHVTFWCKKDCRDLVEEFIRGLH